MRIFPGETEDVAGFTAERFLEWAGRNGHDGASILAVEILEWLDVDRDLDLGSLPQASSPDG
jgi:hypothetical protein